MNYQTNTVYPSENLKLARSLKNFDFAFKSLLAFQVLLTISLLLIPLALIIGNYSTVVYMAFFYTSFIGIPLGFLGVFVFGPMALYHLFTSDNSKIMVWKSTTTFVLCSLNAIVGIGFAIWFYKILESIGS